MYDLFNKARREGLIALESDVEEPDKSAILSKNPVFVKDHHVRDFVCDTMRMAVTGGIEPFDMDQMMEVDMDVHHQGATQPIAALSTMADSCRGWASWRRRWWGHFWASCCATGWWGR